MLHARAGTTLTTRTTRARDTHTMSAVAMSALTASKSAAIAGGAVRAKRATPAAAPRSLVVRIRRSFRRSFFFSRSQRTPNLARIIIIHPRGERSRDRAIWETRGFDDARGVRRRAGSMTRGWVRMDIFLFDYPRASGRVGTRRVVGTPGRFKRVSRCPREGAVPQERALLSDLETADPTDVRRVFDARRGV